MKFWSSEAEAAGFRQGFAELLPAAPGVAAWGLVTGVAMMQSGLGLAGALGMTLAVYAGSAQLAALPLIASGAPLWLVVATALVVNLRFVIYALALRRDMADLGIGRRLWYGYLMGDIGFVLYMARRERAGGFEQRHDYFLGGAACNWLFWQGGSVAGIVAAAWIPLDWGLDLAGTLALLGLLVPMCAARPVLIGAITAAAVAIVAHGLPLRLGLAVGTVAGIAAAMVVGSNLDRGTRG
ncbi:AzlC family ABC transporter permease [Derxia lacustris]|uniref:AzlC family ABC transporter permease n=1 Tax=Derxia lacustris TaxID=764842 RepID=UPI000A174C0A|nr:AzlC family ABC transporter permease [Derxia lacustris]